MQANFPLNQLNTLKVHCTAKLFHQVENSYQLLQLIESPEWQQEKHRILWGGANTLFLPDFFDGLVLKVGIKGIKKLTEENGKVLLQVGAGEAREDLIEYVLKEQLGGIENLIAIPGNVGTSAVSNIGAYGQEVSEVIHEVIGVNLETKTIQKLSREECEFAYRESIFKHELEGKFIITHVVFTLEKIDEKYQFSTAYADVERYFQEQEIDFSLLSPTEKLKTIAQAISEIRATKLPDRKQIWTAGSFFKNPEIWLPQWEHLQSRFPELKAHPGSEETMKLSAGQLIELCGWKGKEESGVKMSEKHALILINTWTSGQAIAEYAKKVQDSVFEKFGIMLEPEVRYCE